MLKESPTFTSIRTPSSYPASHKHYLQGSRRDLRVPYREIALSPTRHSNRIEENPPLPVYDTAVMTESITETTLSVFPTPVPIMQAGVHTRNGVWQEAQYLLVA